jgi:hypothetical protein
MSVSIVGVVVVIFISIVGVVVVVFISIVITIFVFLGLFERCFRNWRCHLFGNISISVVDVFFLVLVGSYKLF